MIVITGATGALNGAVVDHLLTTADADQIAVVARDVSKASRFGVEVRHGDYADPASLPAAFDDADQLLLVSANDPGADAVSLHRAAIDAAVAAGVGRILYTSHQGAGLDSPFRPARHHAATEQLLADSGVPWTSLRNGFYAHTMPWLLGRWRETGTFSVPVDGPVSWTSREDAAEAAAVILASNGRYDGPVTLASTESPTFQDVAAIAGDLIAGTVERTVIGADAWLAGQVAQGTDEAMARFTLGIFEAAGEGRFANDDPTLRDILGREPQTVRELLTSS
jgi:NAD(P)H dehydrogenase (quinone)